MERLGVGRRGDDHCYLHALSPQNLSHIPERDVNLFFLSNVINTVSNCRGLLCFNSADNRTVICNPTTQQLKFLPPTPRLDASLGKGVYAFGFGYDSTSDDYKVIRHYILYNYTLSEHGMKYFAGGSAKIELYSLRHNSWREIPVPFTELLIDFYHGCPYVNGSAYWKSQCGDDMSCVLAFDFATENFSWFSLPPHALAPHTITMSCLFKIDDESLGVVLYSKGGVGRFFELWMWRRGLWTQLYDRVFLNNVENPLGLIDGGRLLFLERDVSCDVQQLVVYDWATKELKELDIYDYKYRNRMMIISYVESRFELPNAMPIGYYDNQASWDEYWRRYEAEGNEVDRRLLDIIDE